MAYLSLEEFKNIFDNRLTLFWQRTIDDYKKTDGLNSTVTSILELVERLSHGGKRIRPYMAYLGYITRGGQTIDRISNDIIDTLISLELFHLFCLIHDDVIDDADIRHGFPTVHAAMFELSEPHRSYEKRRHISFSYAILAGDLVYSWARTMLSQHVPQNTLSTILSLFDNMSQEVIIGQMIDVEMSTKLKVSFADIEQKNLLKTARYTFVHPLKIGAALYCTRSDGAEVGSSHGESISNREHDTFFENIGTLLGSAFQVRDDYIDIVENKSGKPMLGDIEDGQHTIFTQYIFEHGTIHEKKLLDRFFGKKLGDSDKSEVIKLLHSSGALTYGLGIINEKVDEAIRCISQSSIHGEARNLFISLAEAMRIRPRGE